MRHQHAVEFQPSQIERTAALRQLSLVDRNDPITEMIARKIIEIGATENDPVKISEMAIKRLGI